MSLGLPLRPGRPSPERPHRRPVPTENSSPVIAAGNAGDSHAILRSTGQRAFRPDRGQLTGQHRRAGQGRGPVPDSAKGELMAVQRQLQICGAKPKQLEGKRGRASGQQVRLQPSRTSRASGSCSTGRTTARSRAARRSASTTWPLPAARAWSWSPTMGASAIAATPDPRLLDEQGVGGAIQPAAQAGGAKIKMSPERIVPPRRRLATRTRSTTPRPAASTGNGVIKPDVAAPGTAIGSAGVAEATGVAVMTGTSMATPARGGHRRRRQQQHDDSRSC
ncbi:S8 family serine peptidase [Kocuria rhizophila]|nr:S8 family serine peptidase [Kocuria rhizophila]